MKIRSNYVMLTLHGILYQVATFSSKAAILSLSLDFCHARECHKQTRRCFLARRLRRGNSRSACAQLPPRSGTPGRRLLRTASCLVWKKRVRKQLAVYFGDEALFKTMKVDFTLRLLLWNVHASIVFKS